MESSRTLERLSYKLSPASINSYYRCPRKFQFRYIRHVKLPFVFKPALVIGGVTHKALAEIFRNRRDGLVPQSHEANATRFLERENYPKPDGDALRAEHLPIIIGHIERALATLPADAEILDVEQPYQYLFQSSAIPDPVALEARVDLVIRHGDGLVDHIDFKTGAQPGDIIQNFVSRVTVANCLKVPSEKLRTVNVLTKSGEYEVVPSDRRQHAHTWDLVKDTIASLAVDSEWEPRPDPPICRWCDFHPVCEFAQLEDPDGYDD